MPVGPNDIETARQLFGDGGWGSGDLYGPDQWFADDAVMRDIVNYDGAMRGKDEIREFWGSFWRNRKYGMAVRVPAEEIYVAENHRGVAVMWMAYSQITDESGENFGKWRCFEGMSRLEFNDEGEVTLEVDYHHGVQGMCDSWVEHWNARRAMKWEDLGAITGA